MARKIGQEFFEDTIRRRNMPSIRDTIIAERRMKQNEGLPLLGNGYAGNLWGGTGSRLFGGLGDVATFVGADTPANFLYDLSDSIEERLPPPKAPEASLDYIFSPEGLIRETGNTAGSIASILLPTFALPGGTAGTIGRGLTTIPKLGKLFNSGFTNPKLADEMVGRWFTSGVPEAAMESGNNYRNAVAQGMNPEEAWNNRWGVFGRNAAFLPLSNAAQWGLFSKLLGKRPVTSALGGLGWQGVEEFEQEAIQNQASGKPYTYNPIEGFTNPEYKSQRDAFWQGIAGFALPTLGGIVGGKIRNAISPSEKDKDNKPTDNNVRETQETNTTEQNINDKTVQELTSKQAEIWEAAQYASVRAKEKFGYEIPPELIYKQWAHEAGVNFDSPNARYNNNFGGLRQTEPNGEENKQPDGDNYYRHFNNAQEYANAYVDDFVRYYPELSGVKNEREFASVLKKYDYFGDTVENYATGMERITAPSLRTNVGELDEDIYLGENGATEGKYWLRQGNHVDFEGAQPDLMNAIDMLAKFYHEKTGKRLVITAGTNGDHADGKHSHAAGWKVDVNDYGYGEDGALTTPDGGKGWFADEFIEYGRSLGLGMNWATKLFIKI